MADEQTQEQIDAQAADAKATADQATADAEAKAAAEAKATADQAAAGEDKEEFVDDGANPEGEIAVAKKDGEEDDEDLADEDKDLIGKAVKKAIAPLENTIYNNTVNTELNNILTQNPEYKPYEARIRRFVTAPNRKDLIKAGLPVRSVVIEAIAPFLQQIGAKMVKTADAKADLTKDTGSQD